MTNGPINIYVRNGTADYHIFDEVFSSNTYSADLIDYTQIASVYDLGAHIGAFSRYVKDRNPAARIVAVEPDLQNATCYLMNMQQFASVMLVTARVAYDWLDVQLVRTVGNSGGISFVQSETLKMATLSETHSVEPGESYAAVTLAQLGTGDVDLMKIDIEGAEFDVLLNAPLVSLRRFRWIVGEYHGLSGDFSAIVRRLAPVFDLRRQEATDQQMGYFCFERRIYGE